MYNLRSRNMLNGNDRLIIYKWRCKSAGTGACELYSQGCNYWTKFLLIQQGTAANHLISILYLS